jgi:aspartate racemase
MRLVRDEERTNYPITIAVDDFGQGFGIVAQCSGGVDPHRIATYLMTALEGLIHALAESAEQPITQISILSEEERRRVLVEFNATSAEYPSDQLIHQLFEAQVERTPEAVALVCEGASLTYRELNRRANQLGHYLRDLGLRPDDRVALCVERSLELVVGLLGILKAGGAYVPLDPTYPAERLAYLLQDSAPVALLTQGGLQDRLPEHSLPLVLLDGGTPLFAQHAIANLAAATGDLTAQQLAYVIYTSGSTGQPKGVMVEHRSVVRLVQGSTYADLTPREVVLQFAPSSFDAATFEIWGSLLNGAQLVIAPPHTPSLADLGRTLQHHHVTTLWLTAPLFHLMVDEQLESLRGVRQLLAGGDVLSAPHVRQALQSLGECRVINGYGPTENTTFTCCYPMTASSQVGASVPIGRPIANTQVYLLDAHLQPVPVGVPGELYTGGHGLARGYLNRPDLTAERFIVHPFSAEPGARLYRTGDLARYRSDGTIEFLGRLDQQVKVRGYRVELGEIEATLAKHPAVGDVLVEARQDAPGSQRLVAYLVAGQQPVPPTSELRAFLHDQLPEYMIPAAYVWLAAFPLTANGKVDRRALPAPDQSAVASQPYEAPRGAVEGVIAGIWQELLGLERVGRQDHFFELGGHSLLATQVVTRLRAALDVEVPLPSLFQNPTMADLAEYIEIRTWVQQAGEPAYSGAANDREEGEL